jgi:hypothetical protein
MQKMADRIVIDIIVYLSAAALRKTFNARMALKFKPACRAEFDRLDIGRALSFAHCEVVSCANFFRIQNLLIYRVNILYPLNSEFKASCASDQ